MSAGQMCQIRTSQGETAHEPPARHRYGGPLRTRESLEGRPEFVMNPVQVGDPLVPARGSFNSELEGGGTETAQNQRTDSGFFQRLSWLGSSDKDSL